MTTYFQRNGTEETYLLFKELAKSYSYNRIIEKNAIFAHLRTAKK
jgi:hypothetical protein